MGHSPLAGLLYMHCLLKMLSAGTGSADPLNFRFGPSFASATSAVEPRREIRLISGPASIPSETWPGKEGLGEDGRERCEM